MTYLLLTIFGCSHLSRDFLNLGNFSFLVQFLEIKSRRGALVGRGGAPAYEATMKYTTSTVVVTASTVGSGQRPSLGYDFPFILFSWYSTNLSRETINTQNFQIRYQNNWQFLQHQLQGDNIWSTIVAVSQELEEKTRYYRDGFGVFGKSTWENQQNVGKKSYKIVVLRWWFGHHDVSL